MNDNTPDVRHPVEGQAQPTPSWAGPYRTLEGVDEVLVPCDTCGGPVYESCRTRWRARGQSDCGTGCEPRAAGAAAATEELCAGSKPANHLKLPEDDREWACLVPNIDPVTGVLPPPVGRHAPQVVLQLDQPARPGTGSMGMVDALHTGEVVTVGPFWLHMPDPALHPDLLDVGFDDVVSRTTFGEFREALVAQAS